MQLGLTENLPALVARRFTTAKEAGHLVFSSTHLSIITTSGIPYQLRYCPALAKKPQNIKPPTESPPKPKPDPFQDPSPDLLIASFPPGNPSHNLVLNKFPVIPNHFILATTAWKPQTDLLEAEDLQAAFACLRAWSDSDGSASGGSDGTSIAGLPTSPGKSKKKKKRLFAFFNSGEESGASQPHRHLQFLPIEAMRDESGEWEPLIDLVEESSHSSHSDPTFRYIPNLHIKHFALPIPLNPTPDLLHRTYIALYTAAVSSITRTHTHTSAKDGAHHETPTHIPASGPARISYNLAMTTTTMLLCPRRSETASLPVDPEKSRDVVDPGVVSLNGTILAGTLMVKAEGEWDALRAEPGLLGRALGHVGFLREDRSALL